MSLPHRQLSSADIKTAVADTGESGLSKNLQNASIATTGTTLAAAPELTLSDPTPQPSTVPSRITLAPTKSGVGGSKATLSWTTPADDGGTPIVGYAIWYNNSQGSVFTSKQVADTGCVLSLSLSWFNSKLWGWRKECGERVVWCMSL